MAHFSSTRFLQCKYVLCFLALSVSSADFLQAQEEGEFTPEALYAPQLDKPKATRAEDAGAVSGKIDAEAIVAGPFVKVGDSETALARSFPLRPEVSLPAISAWARQPMTGPEGRPLPLAGSWNVNMGEWGPDYFVDLLQKGHHVILGFVDPSSVALRAFLNPDNVKREEMIRKQFEEYYRPGLEYAREHNLPIAIRGWNWATQPPDFQARQVRAGLREFSAEESAALLVDGEPTKQTDPLGPIAAWEEWGEFWFGNELMKLMQEVYPDPPMVVFLNNNEAGEPHVSTGLDKSDRFRKQYGDGPHSAAFLDEIMRKGFDERYEAMFAAARNALVAPAWKENVRLVAYNTLWGAVNIGNGNRPIPSLNFTNEKGWTKWRRYDGDMTEFYANDWQGKNELRPGGMQMEAGSIYSIHDWLLEQNPDFLITNIFWDGGVPSDVFRGRRAVSKTYSYISNGQRWGFDRYEGWAQFCLWAARPRLAFEFRGGEPRDAVREGVWMALLDSVDRPWNNATLEEFWRHGKLVPNRAERPWFDGLTEDSPEWLREKDRWFLLTTDANPPRSAWQERGTRLAVFAQALVLGEAPQRQWLVYAHAPGGAQSDVGVMLPEFGAIQLPSVPLSGSFFLVKEEDRSLQTLLSGGPDQLRIEVAAGSESQPSGKWYPAGSELVFNGEVAHAPNRSLQKFTWDFADGGEKAQSELGPVVHSFAEPGVYLVRLVAEDDAGQILSEEIAVHVGNPPDEAVIYDLALDQASEFEGPWVGSGEDGKTLITYRHVPNAGKGNPGVAAGIEFVEDPERGTVAKFDGAESGLWMSRNADTTLTGEKGASNRTISFWFKAREIGPRQMLYASGLGPTGMNIYLDGDRIFAGSWAVVDGKRDVAPPQFGYGWKGDWIEAGPIESDQWYHVAWVLENGNNKVEKDKQRLFLNGELVGSAPGASIPAEYMPPRLGRSSVPENPGTSLTRFHDEEEREKLRPQQRQPVSNFRGLLSGFRFVNAAEIPDKSKN